MVTPAERPPHARWARWAAAVAALVGLAAIGLRARRADPRAPSGPVVGRATVIVYYDGKPSADRWVVFQDAAGNAMSQVRSDADGKAAGDVVAGAMVTVAYGTSMHQLVTVLEVKPGDEVLVGEREDEGGAGDTAATAKVKLPGAYPAAARYGVSLGVSTTDVSDVAKPLPMPVLRRFLVERKFEPEAVGLGRTTRTDGGPQGRRREEFEPEAVGLGRTTRTDGGPQGRRREEFRVLALAFDARGEALAFAFTWAALAGTDAGNTDVELPAWSTDWRETHLVLSNPPDGLTKVSGELAIVAGEDARFERGRAEADIHGTTSLRFAVPRPLGAKSAFKLELLYGASGDRATLTRRAEQLPEDVPLDLRAVLLPRVSAATVETKQDRGRPIVKWTVSGDASRADVAIAQIAWPETREHVWTIVGPPTLRGPLVIPELPEALREWQPDGRPMRIAAGLVEASFYAGYDDVRKKGLQLLSEPPDEDDEMSLATSVTGDLVF